LTINMGNNKKLMAFLDNSVVKVEGDVDHLEQMKISGSTLNNDFRSFKTTFDPLFDKLMKLSQQYQAGMRTDSIMEAMNLSKADIQKQIDLFIKKRRGSAVSAFLLAATLQLSDDILLT